MCLGKGDGTRASTVAGGCNSVSLVTADGNDWFLLSLRPHMFQFSRRKVPTRNASVECCPDGSVLFLLLGLLFVDWFLHLWLLRVTFRFIRSVEDFH